MDLNRETGGASSAQATDLDGDGDLDLLVTHKIGFFIDFFENLGGSPPTFAERQIIGTFPTPPPPPPPDPHTKPNLDPQPSGVRVFAADLDGDGDIDIAGKANEALGWFENDGAPDPSFTFHDIFGEGFKGHFLRSIVAADIDADGNLDIVATSNEDVSVAWYANDGGSPPVFELRTIEPHSRVNKSHLCVADMDADGDLDILSFAPLVYFENDGSPEAGFTAHLLEDDMLILAMELTDLDGDGLPDLLTKVHLRPDDTTIRETQWRRNLGGTPVSFGAPRILGSTIRMMDVLPGIHAADLDGDGDLDVLSSLPEEGRVEWFENIPMPINAARHWLNYR